MCSSDLGDLILIYQVQGVFINGYASGTIGLPNDTTWGRVVDYYNTGKYEFAQVRAVPNANSITLDCGLKNNYDVNATFFYTLIVRVPRYTSLTINSGGVLTCDDWNGTSGGVLAVEVEGNAVINTGGIIDATGKGFRGGSLVGDNLTAYGVNNVASNDASYGAEKGESVTGYQADYDLWGGRYGRGAAANGGGGGCAHNAGGGGGANAAQNIFNWKGYGIPDLTGVNYTTAWNLDNAVISTLTNANSAGGGRGGGGLEHHGAAGGERRADLAGDHRVGEVPRRDRRAHAHRLADHHDALVGRVLRDRVTVDALAFLGEPLDEGCTVGDLATRLAKRLALLGRDRKSTRLNSSH